MPKTTKPPSLDEVPALRARLTELEQALSARDREIAELRLTERRASVLLGNVDHIFWILTADLSRVIYISPAYGRIFGRSCQSVVEDPRPWWDAIHPDDRERVLDVARRRTRGEAVAPDTLVFRMYRTDGSLLWIRGRGFLVRGDPDWYVGFGEDITARRAAEQEAAERAEQLRLITDQVPAILWTTDADLRITSSAGAGLALLGLCPGQLVGMTLHEALGSDDPEGLPVAAHRRALTGQAVQYENEFGGRAFATRVEPMRDESGRVRGVLGLALDITGRKQVEEELRHAHDELGARVKERTAELSVANQQLEREMAGRLEIEAALRESEERYRLLAQHSTDMISRHALDGRYLYASPACRSLLGYEPEELVGRDAYDLFHPDDVDAIVLSHRTILEKPVDFRVEYRIRRKDGEYIWFETISKTIRDPGTGELRDIIGVSRDITERKRAEERAVQLQSELAHVTRLSTINQMTSGLAHELNQPLAAISTYVDACKQLIHKIDSMPAEVYEALEEIGIEARRAGRVIQQLRALLRRREPQESSVNPNNLVRQVVELTRASVRSTGSALRLDLAPDLPSVVVDTIQIQHVILNLVTNALEAMEASKDGERILIIRTRRTPGNRVEVTVRDTGCGLPIEDPSRVFEPFYTTKEKGVGLGLAISRTLVETHGGHLSAAPNPDCGASFTITLPLGPEGQANA
jgi:PAS domain S-box-containing protein